jgi:tetratricopeptide (TPR) repeat protein
VEEKLNIDSAMALKKMAEIKLNKCDICGVESDIKEAFKEIRRSWSRKRKKYCPFCLKKRLLSEQRRILIMYCLYFMLGLFLVVIFPSFKLGWLLLNLLLIYVFYIIAIVLHEAGHACGAGLLGIRVFAIIVGIGRTLYEHRLFGIDFVVTTFPFGGLSITRNKSVRFFRTKCFLVTISGPLVNLIILISLLNILNRYDFFAILQCRSLYPVIDFALANLLVLFGALWPHKSFYGLAKFPSDGLSLITIWFLKKKDIEREVALYYCLKGQELNKYKSSDEAKKCFEDGLKEFPCNKDILNNLGVLLLDEGQMEDSIKIFRELLGSSEVNDNTALLFKNNIAYVEALAGNKELLTEAAKLSKEVFEKAPWVPIFRGTRGTVLIEQGCYDQGLDLLKEAMSLEESPENKGACAYYIAIGEYRRGKVQEAQGYYEEARKLAPENWLLTKVGKELNLI